MMAAENIPTLAAITSYNFATQNEIIFMHMHVYM